MTTTTSLDTVANTSAVSEKVFKSLPKLSKVYRLKVMSDSEPNLCPIAQCDLTFQLGNKHFTDRFIVPQDP